MKKSILILGSLPFLALTIFYGCQSSSTKVQNAEEKVQDAEQDLAVAKTDLYTIRLDTISSYEQFVIEAEKIIKAQEKSIASFKAKTTEEKEVISATYDQKLIQLEMKNIELKRKLADYKDEGQDTWGGFKTEFNHDMKALGKAFKDLTVENVK